MPEACPRGVGTSKKPRFLGRGGACLPVMVGKNLSKRFFRQILRGSILPLGILIAGCQSGPLGASNPPSKLELLDEILRSGGDNDPRLDRDFGALSDETKRLIRDKYRQLPREKLNERGTIVYILASNLRSPADWDFMKDVVSEPACLSLADCSAANAAASERGDEVTLAYPALVALKRTQRVAERSPSREALELIETAKRAQTPIVAKLARSNNLYQ